MRKVEISDALDVRRLIEAEGVGAFYRSDVWREKRAAILLAQHYECQRCRRRGKYTRAKVVHHKKHLREFPELALADDNLEALCEACHNEEHPEKLEQFNRKSGREWNDEKW